LRIALISEVSRTMKINGKHVILRDKKRESDDEDLYCWLSMKRVR
jgi:hypothetical protein